MINEIDGASMVYVPAGEFLMGSESSDADRNEAPEHIVYLDAFWIYQYEVTNAQYHQCIQAGECMGDEEYFPGDDYPAANITWIEADLSCKWAGAQLPTEAQWEKAARGKDGRTYPWGIEQISGYLANHCDKNCAQDWKDTNQDDSYIYTAPVGSFPAGASPYGAMDMSGNVSEWVSDWYDAEYYDNSPKTNITGPSIGDVRVVRGGSWYSYGWLLRVSYRGWGYPNSSGGSNGFRCIIRETP